MGQLPLVQYSLLPPHVFGHDVLYYEEVGGDFF